MSSAEGAIVAAGLVAINFLKTSARIGRAVLGSPDDSNEEWVPIFEPTHSYLSIIDVPITQTSSATTILNCKVDDTNCKQEPIAAALGNLPEQNRTDIRVYIEENLAHDEVFIDHVTRTASQHFADEYCLPATTAFTLIQSQCRSTEAGQWWSSQSFHHLHVRDESTPSPGNNPMSTTVYTTSIRCSKRIRFATDNEGRLIVFISCTLTISLSKDLIRPKDKLDRLLMSDPYGAFSTLDFMFGHEPKLQVSQEDIVSQSTMAIFTLLDAIGQHIIDSDPEHRTAVTRNPSPDNLRRLFFLRLIHGFTVQFSEYLDDVETLEGSSDTTPIILAASSVRSIAQATQMYEELRASLNSLTTSTEALLQILIERLNGSRPLRILGPDLRALANDNTRRVLRRSEALDSHVKCIQLYKSVSDGSRSWLISILASIFLPLSLACGILSMQTRLVNLHFLLYDFCGVLVLFGTMAIAIVIGARAYASWREAIAQRNRVAAFKQRRPVIELTIGTSALLVWGLFTASFLVGMIKDVILGLKILGFGTAGLAVLTCLIIFVNNVFWNVRQGQSWVMAIARSVV